MAQFHKGRSRFLVLGVLLALLLVGAAASGSAAGTGTIKAVVKYPDAGGVYRPWVGVEVILIANGVHYACTGADGVATFSGIPAGGDYFAAVEPGRSDLQCANPELLEPGTGLKMYAVFYNNHVGEEIFNRFDLAAGQTKTLQFRTERPPADQTLVCGGMPPTIVGTPGPDVLVGTNEPDIISGGAGNDIIKGMGNSDPRRPDMLCGGPGRDRILGGAGDDMMFGEGGNDSGGNRGLFGGPGTDMAYGGAGTDTCQAETALGC